MGIDEGTHFGPEQFGYKTEDIVSLTDDARNPRQIPTRQNIVCCLSRCSYPESDLSVVADPSNAMACT